MIRKDPCILWRQKNRWYWEYMLQAKQRMMRSPCLMKAFYKTRRRCKIFSITGTGLHHEKIGLGKDALRVIRSSFKEQAAGLWDILFQLIYEGKIERPETRRPRPQKAESGYL